MTPPWEDPRIIKGLDSQFARRSVELAGGATPIGWKVGFGAPASLELMETTAPLLGYLTDRTVVAGGNSIDVADWARGVVEFELAVYMGSDLGADASPAEVRAAVAAVGPAIELADIDVPLSPDHMGDVIAGNIFHKAVILGEPDEQRAGLVTDGLAARAFIDGAEYATTTELERLTGTYTEVVATVASTLAAREMTLRTGDLIITGSVFPPVPIGEGTHYEFRLGTYPPISVGLAR